MEEEKQELINNIRQLEDNLKQASNDIDQATDEYSKIKEALKQTDKIYAEKTRECNMLHDKLLCFEGGFQNNKNSTDVIVNAVEEKIEEWKKVNIKKNLCLDFSK